MDSSFSMTIPRGLPHLRRPGRVRKSGVMLLWLSAVVVVEGQTPSLPPTPSPSLVPSAVPSSSVPSTASPSRVPTPRPSGTPTNQPTPRPTDVPTFVPTYVPSTPQPSGVPVPRPTYLPSPLPTSRPSGIPVPKPSATPTTLPTSGPTPLPTLRPTTGPTSIPSSAPTPLPSKRPTPAPTTPHPTECPTHQPTTAPPTTVMSGSGGSSSSSTRLSSPIIASVAAGGLVFAVLVLGYLGCFRRRGDGGGPKRRQPLRCCCRKDDNGDDDDPGNVAINIDDPRGVQQGSSAASVTSTAEEAPQDEFASWDYASEEARGLALLPEERKAPEESYAVRRRGRMISFHETRACISTSLSSEPEDIAAVEPRDSDDDDHFDDENQGQEDSLGGETTITPQEERQPCQSLTTVRVRWTEEDAYANALVRRFEVAERDGEALPPNGGIAEGDYLQLVKATDGFDVRDEAIASDADLHAALDRADIWPYQHRLEAVARAVGKLRIGHAQGRVELKIRRKAAFKGGFKAFKQLQLKGWRMSWFVKFHQESGLDAGGLSREFWRLTMNQAFSEKFGLFKRSDGGGNTTYDIADTPVALNYLESNDDDAAYERKTSESIVGEDDDDLDAKPTDVSSSREERERRRKEDLRLDEYRFVGRGLGKMLFDAHGGCLDAAPNVKLLKLLVGEPLVFDDLQLIDESLWLSLSKLRTMDDDDIRSLALTFAVSQIDPKTKIARTYELCDRGDDRAVHKGNIDEFLEARLRHAVFPPHHRDQLTALVAGFHDVVPPSVMLLLTARELELALCGLPKVDLDDMKRHTVYKGDFAVLKAYHPVCAAFWATIEQWDDEKRARLLQWATGSAKLPVGGFANLQQRDGVSRMFTLTSVDLNLAVFPRAHSCFNRIDLPLYRRPAVELGRKLNFAIHHATGEFTMD